MKNWELKRTDTTGSILYITQIQLGWENTKMIPSISVSQKEDGQELLNWWMPPPELLCQMIVDSRLSDRQRYQLKGELSTDLRAWASTLSSGSCPFTDGHTTVLSQYCPQAPDTPWCWCLHVYERDIWQSDASAALPALLPAYRSAVSGELEAVPWLHSSIPKAQLLSGCRPERLLKSTLKIIGPKGDGVLRVMCFFIRGYFSGLS